MNKFLLNSGITVIVLVFLALVLGTQIITGSLLDSFGLIENENQIMDNVPLVFQLLVGVLILPFLETYIFQKLIIEKALKHTKNATSIIGVSAIVFALFHFYNFYYFIAIIPVGWILAYLYFNLHSIKKSPFLITALVHTLNNSVAFITENVNI